MRAIFITIAFATMTAGANAAEAPVISCRAIGMTAEQNETMCIRTNFGPRMARCGMVLNVSSWTFLGDACDLRPEAPQSNERPSEPAPLP